MEKSLYKKVSDRIYELGMVREHKIKLTLISLRQYPLILSDVIVAIQRHLEKTAKHYPTKEDVYLLFVEKLMGSYNVYYPYLQDQSDELGEKLLALIS